MLKKIENPVIMRDVTNALFELGILESVDTPITLSDTLRDDLGLDSQEVVSLAEIASTLGLSGVPLDDAVVDTVEDVVLHLAANRDAWLPDDVLFVLQGSTVIHQPIATVFDYIANYTDWPNVLAHVTKIEPDYDDGRFQSFKMHIKELGTGEAYFVQSWRYVNAEQRIIDFAQPLPPKGFKLHRGGWRFKALDENRTALISYHGFDLEDAGAAEGALELIRKHIQAALTTWARYGNGKANV